MLLIKFEELGTFPKFKEYIKFISSLNFCQYLKSTPALVASEEVVNGE